MDEQDKKGPADILKEVIGGALPPEPKTSSSMLAPTHNKVGGDGIAGGQNNTFIKVTTPKLVRRTKVIVQRDDEHISDEQSGNLKALVDEIVKLENIVRREPVSYVGVWSSLNKKMRVPAYRLIPKSSYTMAERYLRTWLGRLRRSPTARKRDPKWRAKKIAYIKINVRSLSCEERFRGELQARFGVASLRDMTDEQIEIIYNIVAGWKRRARAAT